MKFDLSQPLEALRAQAKMNQLITDKKVMELKQVRLKRSIKQNSFLHVCISLFAIEFGYTLDEAKTLLKREKGLMYEKNDSKFLKRTRDMDSKELSEFVEWIRHYASLHGCYIPTAEEYLKDQIGIDKTISQNEMYL